MSIPYWRYVKYTDDGYAEYQCLSCYKSYDGRTAPGWRSIDIQVNDISYPSKVDIKLKPFWIH